MADIFISYSQKDRAIVAPLAAFLEGQGYDVWWDTGLTGGAQIRQEIGRQLAAARQVIVVWSANSAVSDWVLDESDEAKRSGKLLPTRVEGFPLQAIPAGFRQLETKLVTDRVALLTALAAKGIAPSKGTAVGGAEAARADGVAGRRWMWWSTYESIAAEVPSVWAIVETVLAVAAYWCAAIWLETYAFLLAGVAIAPMVLLRSDASVALGLRWFQRFEANLGSGPTWREMSAGQRTLVVAIVVAAAVISIPLCWWLSARYLVDLQGLQAFLGGAVIGWLLVAAVAAAAVALALALAGVGAAEVAGVGAAAEIAGVGAAAAAAAGAVAGAVAGVGVGVGVGGVAGAAAGAGAAAVALAGSRVVRGRLATALASVLASPHFVVFGLAFTAALFVVSLLIRTLATLRHLPAGLLAMPRNFRRLALSTSPLQTPELVPGISTTDSILRLDNWIASRTKGDWTYSILDNITLLAYIPAWAYRVSIKSTAWFWWPLAYVGREPHEARDPDHMRLLVLGSPLRRLGRWMAIASLLAFVVVSAWDYIRTNGLDLPALPTQTLVIGFLLTRLADVPWQVAGLISAAMALLVGMWTRHAAISLDHANNKKDLALLAATNRQFVWIEFVGRVGLVCTILYWLALAGHLALYVNSQRCWFEPPPAVMAWANKFYGDLAPPAPRCSQMSSDGIQPAGS